MNNEAVIALSHLQENRLLFLSLWNGSHVVCAIQYMNTIDKFFFTTIEGGFNGHYASYEQAHDLITDKMRHGYWLEYTEWEI